jgi:hypothetical protein
VLWFGISTGEVAPAQKLSNRGVMAGVAQTPNPKGTWFDRLWTVRYGCSGLRRPLAVRLDAAGPLAA